jgi:hypothetical protein
MTTQKDPKRVAAGRKGGQTTRDRHGTDFYRTVGKLGGSKGGTATRDLYGPEFFRRIGALGGRAGRGRPKPAHDGGGSR